MKNDYFCIQSVIYSQPRDNNMPNNLLNKQTHKIIYFFFLKKKVFHFFVLFLKRPVFYCLCTPLVWCVSLWVWGCVKGTFYSSTIIYRIVTTEQRQQQRNMQSGWECFFSYFYFAMRHGFSIRVYFVIESYPLWYMIGIAISKSPFNSDNYVLFVKIRMAYEKKHFDRQSERSEF